MPYLLAGSYQPGRYEPKNEQLGIVRDPFGRPEWIRLGEPDWIRLGELNWIRLGGLNLDQIARTMTAPAVDLGAYDALLAEVGT